MYNRIIEYTNEYNYMNHIKWPSIKQFRDVVKNVEHKSRFVRVEEDGTVVMNRHAPVPTLKYEGTVKLHGTNASIVLHTTGDVYAQSRVRVITPEKDNAGFAMFVAKNEVLIRKLMFSILDYAPNGIGLYQTPVIFGEWYSGNIQQNVGINGMPRVFVVFGISFANNEGEKYHLPRKDVEMITGRLNNGELTDAGIFCIYDFPTFNVSIDFDYPRLVQNELNDITLAVEKCCPVANAFGIQGIGEGVVWRCVEPGYEDSGFWFKVKGEDHSKSKVKTLATVDVERFNNVNELAERLVNVRAEQMYQETFDTLNGGTGDIKRTGDFIKAVMADIFKEDLDMVAASGFTGKDINGPASKIARAFLMKKLEF